MLIDILAKSSDAVGICGVTLLLTAFFLLSTNRITAQHLKYQVLNLCGAILILFSLMFHWNTASVMIEIAWISISSIGIYKQLKNKKALVIEDNIVPFDSKVQRSRRKS